MCLSQCVSRDGIQTGMDSTTKKTQQTEGQITHYKSIRTENSATPFGFDWLDGTRSLHQQPGEGFESRASTSIIRRSIYCAPSRPIGVWERDSFINVYMLKPDCMAWCIVSVYLLHLIDYLWPDDLILPSSLYWLSLAWSKVWLYHLHNINYLCPDQVSDCTFFHVSIIFALIRGLIAPFSLYRLSLPWSEVWLHLLLNIDYLWPDQRSDCTFFPISIIFALIRGLTAPSSLYRLSLAWSEVWLHLLPYIDYLCPDQRSDCTFFPISIIFGLIRGLTAPSSLYRLSLPWSEVWLHLFPYIDYLCPDQRSDCTFFPISIIFALIRGLIAPSSQYPLSLAWSITNLSTSPLVTSQLEGRQVPWPGAHSSLLWPRLRPHGWPRVTNATMVMSNLLSHFLITYPACVWASSLCDQVLSLY